MDNAISWVRSRIAGLVTTSLGAWVTRHIIRPLDYLIYRASTGRVLLANTLPPNLMLTTTGATSGQPRTVPLLYLRDGQRIILVASNYGSASHPAWYHNLLANPTCMVTIGGHEARFVAREAEGAEREELWRRAVVLYAGYRLYQARAEGRRVPLIILDPASERSAVRLGARNKGLTPLDTMQEVQTHLALSTTASERGFSEQVAHNAHDISASIHLLLSDLGPRQSLILRRCALPRWFDEVVLATIRERKDGSEQVLIALSNYSFVRSIDERQYTYYDDARRVLIQTWRDEPREEWHKLHQALAAHALHQQREASDPLKQRRWLWEALYHQLLAEPEDGRRLLLQVWAEAIAIGDRATLDALRQVEADAAADQIWGS